MFLRSVPIPAESGTRHSPLRKQRNQVGHIDIAVSVQVGRALVAVITGRHLTDQLDDIQRADNPIAVKIAGRTLSLL